MPSIDEVAPRITDPAPSISRPALPGRALLTGSRRLLLICLGSGLVYSGLAGGSRGGTDVPNGSGPTTTVQLTMHPSPAIYLAIALIYFVAVHRVLKRATIEARATQIFQRAGLLVVIVVAGSIVLGWLWFFNMPLEGWPDPGTWIAPFPFATQDVVIGR